MKRDKLWMRFWKWINNKKAFPSHASNWFKILIVRAQFRLLPVALGTAEKAGNLHNSFIPLERKIKPFTWKRKQQYMLSVFLEYVHISLESTKISSLNSFYLPTKDKISSFLSTWTASERRKGIENGLFLCSMPSQTHFIGGGGSIVFLGRAEGERKKEKKLSEEENFVLCLPSEQFHYYYD